MLKHYPGKRIILRQSSVQTWWISQFFELMKKDLRMIYMLKFKGRVQLTTVPLAEWSLVDWLAGNWYLSFGFDVTTFFIAFYSWAISLLFRIYSSNLRNWGDDSCPCFVFVCKRNKSPRKVEFILCEGVNWVISAKN